MIAWSLAGLGMHVTSGAKYTGRNEEVGSPRQASGLGATLEMGFGTTTKMLEGHGGTCPVTVNSPLIRTNRSGSGSLHENHRIL